MVSWRPGGGGGDGGGGTTILNHADDVQVPFWALRVPFSCQRYQKRAPFSICKYGNGLFLGLCVVRVILL